MATTKSKLDRLTHQIEALQEKLDPAPPAPRAYALVCPHTWNKEQIEEVRQRNYAEVPENRRAMFELLILI